MTTVTSQEIAQFRSLLADYPQALSALDLIEDCEGDLEDAAMTLAIRAGQQPDAENSEWLAALAKKYRAVICQRELRDELLDGKLTNTMEELKKISTLPKILATPVLMYVFKQGINNFCQPLDTLKIAPD